MTQELHDDGGHESASYLLPSATSRGLLTTVLGEFVLAHGGVAWTQTLTAMLALLGVRDKAARQVLSRLEDRRWLERERLGRQTRWRLTRAATEVLTTGADRIYAFGQQPRAWDGRWVLLVAPVPESSRSVRHRLRTGLNWAGFGSLGSGLWVCPWVEHEAGAVRLLADAGVEGTTFRGELGELGSAGDLAASAWDLPDLRERYDAFLTEAQSLTGEPWGIQGSPGAAAARDLVALVHRWRRFPALDPELPAEVLPRDWPGPEAAARFTEARLALASSANEWWSMVEDAHTPSTTKQVGA